VKEVDNVIFGISFVLTSEIGSAKTKRSHSNLDGTIPKTSLPGLRELLATIALPVRRRRAKVHANDCESVIPSSEMEKRPVLASGRESRRTSSYMLNGKERGSKASKHQQSERPRAPNMSLNVSPDRMQMNLERNCAAVLGLLCQFIILVIAAFLSYYEPWTNRKFLGDSRSPKAYAFPLTAAGTLGVFVGLYMCAKVVERASVETIWRYSPHESSGIGDKSKTADIRCMWLQVVRTGFYLPRVSQSLN
jgi:hypothetical protein